jgi:hypothetical protein
MAKIDGDFIAKECKAVMKYLYLKEHSANKIYDMSVMLGDRRPSYSTIKISVVRFKTEHMRMKNVLGDQLKG